MARPGALRNLGITTVLDLLLHLPRRHEDRREFRPVASAREGELVTLRGTVETIELRRHRGRLSSVRAMVADASGSIEARWWNQPWLAKNLPPGTDVVLHGKVRRGAIVAPEHEVIRGEDALHFGRIVPVYPLTKGVSSPALRRAVHVALERCGPLVGDYLPEAMLQRRGLPGLSESLRRIHFPGSDGELAAARRRLAFDELFFFELAVGAQRKRARSQPGLAHRWSRELDRRIRARFPFPFTAAQDRAVAEILGDLRAPEPMNRLLQGDVGSGKTAVALYAALVCVANRTQVAFLAPTEILARQHHRTIEEILRGAEVRRALLVGATPAAERRELLRGLAAGEVDLVAGTHALLEADVEFSRLGLVVVDEQHRFGVEQRAALIRKGIRPDVLVMTATPIPRTLALTAFGDLDVSVIDELPPGRTPAVTRALTGGRSAPAWETLRGEVARGRQGYVIFPLVEESEEVDAQAAEEGFQRLASGELRGLRLALLTGRAPAAEKERVMAGFRAREIDVLVGTTVLEVGVDVANASVMVVENAERFGLSTLHQLRGRVGRGAGRSFCFLVARKWGPDARDRLRVMEETSDGFRIAEEDLRRRGPGEFFGTRQHGLPEFRVADLRRDYELLREAREEAFALLGAVPKPEGLGPLREELRRRYAGRFALVEV
jgi:ATP-dependent DNA helicase RecG